MVSGACSYPSCSLEDLAMRTLDLSPLFRSTIGFDRLFDLVETAQRAGDTIPLTTLNGWQTTGTRSLWPSLVSPLTRSRSRQNRTS